MSRNRTQRGTVMIVTLVTTIALVGVSTMFIGRVLYEKKLSQVQEDSSQALFRAFGELAKAEAVINSSAYDASTGRNQAVQDALAATDKKVSGTEVTVEPIEGMEGTFFHLVSRAEVGRVTRIVRALIREKESFADYNYFVNTHPLGISGNPTPRGSLHTNKAMEFYFPNGIFIDAVTASEGFAYKAGATGENTQFLGPTDAAAAVVTDLNNLDLSTMKDRADVYLEADANYDTKIVFDGDAAHIEKWSKAHWDEEFVTETRQIQTGTQEETYIDEIEHYMDENYTVTVNDYEWIPETYTVDVPVWETRLVDKTKTVPVYDTRLVDKTRTIPVFEDQYVTKTRTEEVWVKGVDPDAEGGTAIVGGDGEIGYWKTVDVEYEELVRVQTGTTTETYTVEERYVASHETITFQIEENYISHYVEEERTRSVKTLVGTHDEVRSRSVLDYVEEIEKTRTVPVYDTITEVVGTEMVYYPSEKVSEIDVEATGGIIYLEGDVTGLAGQLNGRVTVVSNGTIHITGNIQYIDDDADTAYLNGTDPKKTYQPNPDYQGGSVLGVIARDDIIYTEEVPSRFELNGSFLAQSGRIGIAGIELDAAGDAELTATKVIKDN